MISLSIGELLDGYRARRFTPAAVIENVLERIASAPDRNAWITRLSRDDLMRYVDALDAASMERLPLYGVPFAIKDNIDLAGVPTTAACREFAYTPDASATVVQRLIAAGAIPIGKTNLDQFATGLVGARSPYGPCMNSFDPAYISGGSSSGSAVAVAQGLVSFSLGTDTAGSGRVPAAFNNLIGMKATCGLISTRGVVPACRSLDAVSIFALTAADAGRVFSVAQGYDAGDPFSRRGTTQEAPIVNRSPRIGVPRQAQLRFFGDAEYERCFAAVCARMQSLGWSCIEVDIEPLLEAAQLLYEGPWVAERYAAIGDFLQAHEEALLPVTRGIIAQGATPRAVDAFRAMYRLKSLQRASESLWGQIDALLTPTAGTIYRLEEVIADPVVLNSNLGYYTNFVNLLDLAAIAAPAGMRQDGLPFGATLVARAGSDRKLLGLAAQLQRASVDTVGALDVALDVAMGAALPASTTDPEIAEGFVGLIVCGAHLSGLALNHQLLERGAYLVRAARTASCYRFYALPGGPPFRPGLLRAARDGAAIDVELWAVPQEQLGGFVAGIPAPLGIGKIELESGAMHSGFLCEPYAIEDAHDITSLGGWRRYLAERGKP